MYNIYQTKDVIFAFFANPVWLVLFLLSVIYLFFRMNHTHKKALVAVAIAFFLVINDFVFRMFISQGEEATFYRHLWVIPYMTVIGIAVIDLVKRLPKLAYKIIFVAVFCIGTALIETVNPFGYLWRTPMDRQMVSSDVLKMNQVLEEKQKESDKQLFVVGPDEVVIPLWLYNGRIGTMESIWAPAEKELWQQLLSEESLDIDRIFETGKGYGRDYVIVKKGKKTEKRFRKKGYEPVCVSDDYIMYAFSHT